MFSQLPQHCNNVLLVSFSHKERISAAAIFFAPCDLGFSVEGFIWLAGIQEGVEPFKRNYGIFGRKHKIDRFV